MISNLDLKRLRRLFQQASASVAGAVNTVVDWTNITNKPTEFPPESHDHSINALTEKTSPASNDILVIEDSADSFTKKKVKVTNLSSGGGGGGMSVTEFSTYQDLLDDTTVEEGNIGIVTGMNSALFIRLDEWFGIIKAKIFGVTANTIGWWTFDNDDVTDSSTNEYDGTATDITYVNGKVSRAISLNGSSSNVNLPDDVIFAPTQSFTVSCWIKPANNTQTNKVIWEFLNNTGKTSMILGYNAGSVVFRRIRQGFTDSNFSSSLPNPTDWHLVTWVYDNSLIRLYGYVDGSAVGSIAVSNSNGTGTMPVRSNIGNSEGVSNHYNGFVDEFIMENKVWSASEIMDYYNLTR